MANPVKLTVENPDELLNPGAYGANAVIRLQWSATEGGAYVDVSGTGSTPATPIVTQITSYTAYDPNGTSTTWYRSRYENAGGTRLSDWSSVFQTAPEGSGLLASVNDLRQRLAGDQTDQTQDENLLEWLRQVTSFIHTRTGRVFTPDPVTVYTHDGNEALENRRCLPIPNGVQSISLLEIAPYTGAAFVTIPASEYFLRPTVQDRMPGWPATELWMTDIPSSANAVPYFMPGMANVRRTGVSGWPAIPADISAIALNLAEAAAREGGASGGDTITIGIGGERTYERSLSWKDQRTLGLYTLRTVEII